MCKLFVVCFSDLGTFKSKLDKRSDEKLFLLLLFSQFLRDESLSGSDITSKLEPAFLSGLRCSQPLIRAKFFEVFDASMKRRVYERLLYISCSQNWEAMGIHFWIKQCIEVNTAEFLKPFTLHCLVVTLNKACFFRHLRSSLRLCHLPVLHLSLDF